MNLFTVNKKGMSDLNKNDIKVAYVSIKPDLKVKVSSIEMGGDFAPYHIDFADGDGIHVPRDVMEAHVLRGRQRVLRDVVALNSEALAKALAQIKRKTSSSRNKQTQKKEK